MVASVDNLDLKPNCSLTKIFLLFMCSKSHAPGKQRMPISQKAGWAPEAVRMGKISHPPGFDSGPPSPYSVAIPNAVPAYTHTHIHIHTHTHTHTKTYTYKHTHTYRHTHTHTHINTHKYIHTYTQTHTRTYIHTHTHTYTYIHTYTNTHTYIHTHTDKAFAEFTKTMVKIKELNTL